MSPIDTADIAGCFMAMIRLSFQVPDEAMNKEGDIPFGVHPVIDNMKMTLMLAENQQRLAEEHIKLRKRFNRIRTLNLFALGVMWFVLTVFWILPTIHRAFP